MLSPSTAPRWKRQTKTGRGRTGKDGEGALVVAYAARARNSGSSPKLTSAKPPDFTNTRREIVMRASRPCPSFPVLPRLPPSLSLKLRSADRQPDRQRAGLQGIVDVR